MKTFSYIRRWTLHINHYNIINYLGIFNWYSIHPKNVWEAPYWDSFYLIKHKTSAVVIRKKNGKMQCADTDWLTGKCAWVYIWRKHHIEAILKSDSKVSNSEWTLNSSQLSHKNGKSFYFVLQFYFIKFLKMFIFTFYYNLNWIKNSLL
jgi:hypothetical protein